MARKIVLFLITVIAIGKTYCQKVELLGAESCCLYTDIANPLKVVVDGRVLKAKDYTVELNTGTFLKTDTCLWIKDIKTYNIIVTIKSKTGKLIAKKSFKKIRPPEPEVIADGRYGNGNFPKQGLTNIAGFFAYTWGFPYPTKYKILKYAASITLGNETRAFVCEGPLLSDTVKYYLKKMKPYDRAEFLQFDLSDFRQAFGPHVFEINDYSTMLYDYENLFYDFKGRTYDDYGKIVTWERVSALPIKPHYYDTLPVIVETDCNYNTDDCTTNIFHRINGKKMRTYQYNFSGDDTVRVKWYFNDVLTADISYWKNSLYGAFTLYYENGYKRVEGFNTIGKILLTDTVMRINPLTQAEEQQYFTHIFSYKQGEWIYYNERGEKIFARKFKDDELE